MIYEVEVYEVRSVLCRYHVEADSRQGAIDAAEIGDTISEESDEVYDVMSRTVPEDASVREVSSTD